MMKTIKSFYRLGLYSMVTALMFLTFPPAPVALRKREGSPREKRQPLKLVQAA